MFRQYLGEAPVEQQTAPAAGATQDDGYKVVFTKTLAEGDSFPDLRVNVDFDGDFILTGVYGKSAGDFTIQFKNAAGRPLSSAEISKALAIGTVQFPAQLGPVRFPAGGQIGIAITNKHAGANAVELIFDGIKRRRVGQ